MDFLKEQEEKEEWERGQSELGMTLDELFQLARRGIGRCEEPCLSRSICGEDACACIRSVFPTPDHYETYLLARSYFLKNLAKAAFAALVSEAMNGEKNE